MTGRQLAWIIAGVVAWFGIKDVAPRVAGLILAAVVIGAVVKMGPQLAKLPKQ